MENPVEEEVTTHKQSLNEKRLLQGFSSLSFLLGDSARVEMHSLTSECVVHSRSSESNILGSSRTRRVSRDNNSSNRVMMNSQPAQETPPINARGIAQKRTASAAIAATHDGLDAISPEHSAEHPRKRSRQENEDIEHQQILVGHRVPDRDERYNNIEIPVYARLNAASNVTFHLGKEEADMSKIELSHQMSARYNQVEFDAIFKKATERETKEEIKRQFHMKFTPKKTGT
jgi:hypothetical protein